MSVQPHPVFFVVLFISLRYGFRAGMISIILSSTVYGALLLQLADVRTYLYLLDPPYSTPLVILVPLGVIVGLLSQRNLDRVNAVLVSSEALEHENRKLRGEHEELRDVNLELAGRVVGAEGTVGQLYEFAKQLNVVDEEKVFTGLLQLLGEALGAEESTIWRIHDSHLEFFSSSMGSIADNKIAPDCARFDSLFDDRGVLALHDVPESARAGHLPFLLGKLRDGQQGPLIAYVAVDVIPFARYNEETVRLFRMIVEWASTSLGNVHSGQVSEHAADPHAAETTRFPAASVATLLSASGPAAPLPGAVFSEAVFSHSSDFTDTVPVGDFAEARATVDEQTGGIHRRHTPTPSSIRSVVPESMYNGTLDRSIHELSELRAQIDAEAAAPSPASHFPAEQEFATMVHNRDFLTVPTQDAPGRTQMASGKSKKAFVPSRSVILLNEAGASNPGAVDRTDAVGQKRRKDEDS
ncbi:MAG: hypothetical protein GY811_14015 [Myxococcales bacterium]|nr:hypothetical protein [Myxococcales bacterium]